MNKKERRKALLGLLSEKSKDKKVSVLTSFTPKKTKDFAELTQAIHPDSNGLYVVTHDEEMIMRTGRNLSNAKLIHAHLLNPADLLKYDHLVFTEKALKVVENIYKS